MKAEVFVVAFKNASDNSVKYAGLDSRDSFIKAENPSSLKKGFTHDQAKELVVALRKKGLDENVTIRVKSLGQSVRDYCWTLVQAVNETTVPDDETMTKVLKRYEVKKAETEAETPAE